MHAKLIPNPICESLAASGCTVVRLFNLLLYAQK